MTIAIVPVGMSIQGIKLNLIEIRDPNWREGQYRYDFVRELRCCTPLFSSLNVTFQYVWIRFG
jgi:hypothetical protein